MDFAEAECVLIEHLGVRKNMRTLGEVLGIFDAPEGDEYRIPDARGPRLELVIPASALASHRDLNAVKIARDRRHQRTGDRAILIFVLPLAKKPGVEIFRAFRSQRILKPATREKQRKN